MDGSGLSVTRGDTLRFEMAVEADGAPLDLTGFQVAGYVRAPFRGVIHEFAPTITPGVGGILTGHFPPAVTDQWPSGVDAVSVRVRFTAPSGDKFTSPPFAVSVDLEGDA